SPADSSLRQRANHHFGGQTMRSVAPAAFVLLPAPLARAAGVNMGHHNTDAPIQVSADQFTADMNSKSGTYSGNVIVTQGDFKLHANTVRVNVVGSKPDKIIANGNVVFSSSSGI